MSSTKKNERQDVPEVHYFDFDLEERVNKCRAQGLKTPLGKRFNDMTVWLRPFDDPAVIVCREASVDFHRDDNHIEEGTDLPGELQLLVSKDAVTMAITGAKAQIKTTNPEMLFLAEEGAWSVVDGVVNLRGKDEKASKPGKLKFHEESELVRKFFRMMMGKSNPLLMELVAKSRKLSLEDNGVIDSMGEDYVYGLAGTVGFRD